VLPGTTSRARTRAVISARARGRCNAAAFGSPRGPLANFETSPAGANRSVRELLDRPYGREQVRGDLGHVVVGDLQDPEAPTPDQERVANRPVLALGQKSGGVDRLTCGELEQITALAADARSLVRLRSVSHATFRPRESRRLPNGRAKCSRCRRRMRIAAAFCTSSSRFAPGSARSSAPVHRHEADVPLTAAHVREARLERCQQITCLSRHLERVCRMRHSRRRRGRRRWRST
jgi:hypothetical protein